MNRYIFIRRLRGPAFLMLVGAIALLAQLHILGWGKSWPLFLILAGGLLLAERAALAADGYPPAPGYPPGYPVVNDPAAQASQPYAAPTGTAIVPANSNESGIDPDRG